MEVLKKVFGLVQDMFLPKWLVVSTLIWVGLFLLCWVIGGIALWRFGRQKGFRKNIVPFVPSMQSYGFALFSGMPHTARRIQHCLWWFWVVIAACLTAGIWLVAGLVGVAAVPEAMLKILLIALACILVLLYLLIRADELACVKRVFKKSPIFAVAVAGALFCLPIYRIFLFQLKDE